MSSRTLNLTIPPHWRSLERESLFARCYGLNMNWVPRNENSMRMALWSPSLPRLITSFSKQCLEIKKKKKTHTLLAKSMVKFRVQSVIWCKTKETLSPRVFHLAPHVKTNFNSNQISSSTRPNSPRFCLQYYRSNRKTAPRHSTAHDQT